MTDKVKDILRQYSGDEVIEDLCLSEALLYMGLVL